ncbi:hypothetical protein ILUMI_07249, partial [Ignelater luminosus]
MFFVVLSTVVILFTTECTMQECSFEPNKFTKIACFNASSIGEIENKINDTLNPYGPVNGLIKVLKLELCELLELTIDSLKFLPNLEEIIIINSNIMKIAPYSADSLPNSALHFDDNTKSENRTK